VTPGTQVSDGILRGKLIAIRDGQALVTVEAGATIWLPAETLKPFGPKPAADTWEAPACVTPGCANQPQPGGLCRSCIQQQRRLDRAAGLVDLCTYGNCRRVVYSQNLCKTCYERERRAGNIKTNRRVK
jgi:hypothetical protein